MRIRTHCLVRTLVWLSLSACLLVTTMPTACADDNEIQAGGKCRDHPISFYASSHYKIAAIKPWSPFDYLHNVRQLMNEAVASANVHKGDDFTAQSVNNGRRKIREKLIQLAAAQNLPITVNVVTGEIANCRADTQPPSLDVVYNAFSTWAPFVFTRTFEHQASQTGDPASASGIRKLKFQLVPQVGYNASANLYGGGQASLTTHAGKFNLGALGASEMLSLGASFAGEHTWQNNWINASQWRAGLAYEDAPTGTSHLQRARLTVQGFANSAPIGSSNTIMRFGVSLGGGHDQSNVPADQLSAGSVSSSPIGEFKTYAGISGRAGRNSFKLSYGFQLGAANKDVQVDFAKHIADAAYGVRFLPQPHKPVEINAHVTGGWIQNLGAIPVAERFFGGNSEQQFLMGDSWRIRAGPFIRSIPQNKLNRLTPDQPIGGENFFSANVTLGATVWNRPLMPDEIRTNRTFHSLLATELKNAQKNLGVYWLSKDKNVPNVLSLAPPLNNAVHELSKSFDGVQDSVPDELADRFDDCDFQVTILAEGFVEIIESNANQSKRFIQMKSLLAEDDAGSINHLIACVTDLRSLFGPNADSRINTLKSAQEPARDALAKLDKAAADMKASRDMAFVDQTVNTLLDQMNYIAISPIAIFDVARIGPQTSDAGGGFRYGIGGGVRFTVLDTIRLDAGYAVNPDPKPWEGRGAAFFSLEVISLFR
jgi:hypothetical protein